MKKTAIALLSLMAAFATGEAVAEAGYVACIYNGTGQQVKYGWRECADFHDGRSKCSDDWARRDVDAGYYATLQVVPSDDVTDLDAWFDSLARVRIEVDFDNSFDEGYQQQTYMIDTTKERDYIDEARCDPGQRSYRFYHFKKVSNGLDLFHD